MASPSMRQIRAVVKKVSLGLKLAAVAAVAAAALAGIPTAQPWWKLEVRLAVQGDYEILAEGVAYPGEFTWSGFWRGTVERDELDLILRQEESGTLEWRLVESPPEAPSPAWMENPPAPVLRVHYVVRNGSRFDFDLDAEGPAVPARLPACSLPLPLPSSAETALRLPELGYEAGLSKGSNRVFLEAEDVGDAAAARSFAWAWKDRRWVPRPGGAVRILTSHRVKATVSVRPGDGGRRRPAAAAHG